MDTARDGATVETDATAAAGWVETAAPVLFMAASKKARCAARAASERCGVVG